MISNELSDVKPETGCAGLLSVKLSQIAFVKLPHNASTPTEKVNVKGMLDRRRTQRIIKFMSIIKLYLIQN